MLLYIVIIFNIGNIFVIFFYFLLLKFDFLHIWFVDIIVSLYKSFVYPYLKDIL